MINENIMIIGAGGSLGKCLCSLLIKEGCRVIAVDIDENSMAYLHRVYDIPEEHIYIENIRDFDKLKSIIDYNNIDLVINCAALKHVMWCEYNIRRAIDINIIANLELMNYLSKNNKKFIYISSDKATNAQNIYALTKHFTDYIVNFYNFKLVRGVNFINSKGSVLDVWNEQKALGRSFTLIKNKECNRYFITIKQMAQLVLDAINDHSDKVEYTPDIVYKIYIHSLFQAYIKEKNILNCKIKEVSLSDNEKVGEDLNFKPKIIELRDIDEIIGLIKDEI